MVSVARVVAFAEFVFALDESVIGKVVAVDEVAVSVASVGVIGDAVVVLVELVIFVSVFSASASVVD